tara:strand:+ start:55 stop:501 length:447 start_codon:yes stop_codon:yes gene_type:complete
MIKQPSEDEAKMLHSLVEDMIPQSEAYNLPSAGEELIFSDILNEVRRNFVLVKEELFALNKMAEEMFGISYKMLGEDKQNRVSMKFVVGIKKSTIARIVLQCYYRDDRVMRSLGMEPRPPFPLGHVIDNHDWSLLEVVKKKNKTFRSI